MTPRQRCERFENRLVQFDASELLEVIGGQCIFHIFHCTFQKSHDSVLENVIKTIVLQKTLRFEVKHDVTGGS